FVEEWIICRINFFRFDVDNLLTVFIKGGVAILDLGIGLIWLQPLRFAAAIFHIQNPLFHLLLFLFTCRFTQRNNFLRIVFFRHRFLLAQENEVWICVDTRFVAFVDGRQNSWDIEVFFVLHCMDAVPGQGIVVAAFADFFHVDQSR